MPSLNAQDRAPLCLFTYEDHRRCRTPRLNTHPHFCYYHAQKESQSQAAEKLADDLAYFFSGDYLTANDLNAALARLIPATIRGEIKPRLARTVAYMLQTLLQSSHQAQHEYINAFSTDGWRQAVADSVNNNHAHRYPEPPAPVDPAPTPPASPQPPAPPQHSPTAPASKACHPERSEGSLPDSSAPTTDETRHPSPTHHPTTVTEAALTVARNLFPERPNPEPTQPEPPPAAPTAPTQTAPPPLPPGCQASNPLPDPFHFDATHRLYIDGKPW